MAIANQIVGNLARFGSLLNENIARQFGNNYVQIPSSLSIKTDLNVILFKRTIIDQNDLLIEQVQFKPYQVFKNTYSNALYVPNGQIISKYEYFDWIKGEYFPYNLHLRIVALDQEGAQQNNLNDTYCEINSRLLKDNETTEFSTNYTSFNNVSFNGTDYNLDDIIFYLDDELNMTLQLQFRCNSVLIPIYGEKLDIVGYHSNYYLRINIKTLPCQMGEIKRASDLTCSPCDAQQGQFSVTLHSQNCTIIDDSTTKDVTSAQMNLKSGYWRPYFYTDQVSQCSNLMSNCLGGWQEGDTSCLVGHIGALCEECDLYNLRGDGDFSTSSKYSCKGCSEKGLNSIIITIISFWTLISILISVKSTISVLKAVALKVQLQKFRFFMSIKESHSGILVKMLTNHLQILSTITSFKLNFPTELVSTINATGNPLQTLTYSLDCFLKDMFNINIQYSRIIWQLIMPLIYIFFFFTIYWIAIILKKMSYNISVIMTTFIYLYIYLQPNLVGGLISLIAYRNISNFKWIQANVAYRHDTNSHIIWLLSFCLPSIFIIGLLIPFLLFYALYKNRERLNEKRTRQKWGYLYNEYNNDVYFWEIVKIVEKELLIIFLSYYEETIVKKAILVLLVLYIYQELNTRFKPYLLPKLNKLDAYSANICEISIALGIGIFVDGSLEFQLPYILIIVTLNMYYLLLVLKQIISSYNKRLEVHLDKVRDFLRQKAPWIMKLQFFKKELQNRQSIRIRVQKRYKKLREYLMKQGKQIIKFKKEFNSIGRQHIPKIYIDNFDDFSSREQLFFILRQFQKELKSFLEEKGFQSSLKEGFVQN